MLTCDRGVSFLLVGFLSALFLALRRPVGAVFDALRDRFLPRAPSLDSSQPSDDVFVLLAAGFVDVFVITLVGLLLPTSTNFRFDGVRLLVSAGLKWPSILDR